MSAQLSADGYVYGNPQFFDNESGKYYEIVLKVPTRGRETLFVIARFYGSKINGVKNYINSGDYITMHGCVFSFKEKQAESGRYTQIVLSDAWYTLPPRIVGEAGRAPSGRSGSADSLDTFEDGDDN